MKRRPPPDPRILTGPAAAVVLTVLCGCAPSLTIRAMPKAPLTGAWGIAVYPFEFNFEATPFESYSRAVAVAEHLADTTGRVVYGPGEFDVLVASSDDLRQATNLGARVHYTAEHTPRGLYVLRISVEQRVSEGTSVTRDAKGRTVTRGDSIIDVVVHAQLLSMAENRVVAELEGGARVDPSRGDASKDAFPEVTRVTDELIDELVQRTGLATTRPPVDLGLRVAAVPKPALDFARLGTASGTADPLEREARILGVIKQLDPGAPRDREHLYLHAPYGLVVIGASGRAAAAGLKVGDLLTEADDDRLLSRSVLLRHLADGETHVHFKRGGSVQELVLKP